jgi:hypothetical protein
MSRKTSYPGPFAPKTSQKAWHYVKKLRFLRGGELSAQYHPVKVLKGRIATIFRGAAFGAASPGF